MGTVWYDDKKEKPVKSDDKYKAINHILASSKDDELEVIKRLVDSEIAARKAIR